MPFEIVVYSTHPNQARNLECDSYHLSKEELEKIGGLLTEFGEASLGEMLTDTAQEGEDGSRTPPRKVKMADRYIYEVAYGNAKPLFGCVKRAVTWAYEQVYERTPSDTEVSIIAREVREEGLSYIGGERAIICRRRVQ